MRGSFLAGVGLVMSASVVDAQESSRGTTARRLTQSDTLAVERIAIDELLRAHAGGRVIALDDRFAAPGQAPPSMTTILRPLTRQRALENAFRPLTAAATLDTLHVQASAPIFGGGGARVSVTVSHRGSRPRRGFYETVEYRLRRESGRWVIHQRNQLGIT